MARATALAVVLMALLGSASAAPSYANFGAALAANTAQFSGIAQVLKATGLTSVFNNPNFKATVFVPTNAALSSAAGQYKVNVAALPKNIQTQLIYYHIVSGQALTTAQMKNGQVLKTAQGGSITVQKAGSAITLKGVGSSAGIVSSMANIKAGAGYAQAINNVLLPMAYSGRR